MKKKVEALFCYVTMALLLGGLVFFKSRLFIPPTLPIKLEVTPAAQEQFGTDIFQTVNYLNNSFGREVVSLKEGKTTVTIALSSEKNLAKFFSRFSRWSYGFCDFRISTYCYLSKDE